MVDRSEQSALFARSGLDLHRAQKLSRWPWQWKSKKTRIFPQSTANRLMFNSSTTGQINGSF